MFEEHLQNTIALVQNNPVIGIGVAVVAPGAVLLQA